MVATHRLAIQNVAIGGDVRINFSFTSFWSYVGTNCKNVHADRPIIQLTSIDDSESRLTPHEMHSILHECGHMLGFVHEHQSPARVAQITFDHKGERMLSLTFRLIFWLATVVYYADT